MTLDEYIKTLEELTRKSTFWDDAENAQKVLRELHEMRELKEGKQTK
jgi:hypothetical protein